MQAPFRRFSRPGHRSNGRCIAFSFGNKEDLSETIIPEDAASSFVAATLADIRVGGDMAGYIPSKDYITLPPAAAFKSMGSYYATTLHELGHNAESSVMPRRSGFARKTRSDRRCHSA
jgi:antirestriction protein ArdC